ncbi:sensor histidine kinase [Spirulina subsalsa]|nr:HAMP domain-containing sensor histidine kinase [Spirulina subsalsa]
MTQNLFEFMDPSDADQGSGRRSPSFAPHCPASPDEFTSIPSSFDLQGVYCLLVQQLARSLPIISSLLVYHDPQTGDRLSVTHPTPSNPELSEFITRQLLTQEFLDLPDNPENPWPTRQIAENIIPIPSAEGVWGYVYPLNSLKPYLEYLLLLLEAPLTPPQSTIFQQQGKLISYYLTLYQTEARQQAKINLLEQVIQRLEHQLRNPLGLIALSAETLRLGLAEESRLSQQAMVIRDTVHDLTQHLTDLLYCGQQANLQIAPYNIRTILLNSLQGLYPFLEEKKIEVDYPEQPVIIPVDQWQIKQVFDNILSNAIHFSPVEEIITCNWQVFKNEVLIEIRDRGCGLSPDEVSRVFQPFYSRRAGGQGLGLAIAQKIILDHQGRLWASNLADGGAQFSFVLPLHHRQTH